LQGILHLEDGIGCSGSPRSFQPSDLRQSRSDSEQFLRRCSARHGGGFRRELRSHEGALVYLNAEDISGQILDIARSIEGCFVEWPQRPSDVPEIRVPHAQESVQA
jgi:hypothetical protein